MDIQNSQILNIQNTPPIHWGHFGVIMGAIVLLAGASWMEKPELFSLHQNQSAIAASNTDAPKYYAYVTPPEDQPQPEVLGASTNDGPSIINDDGSVSPVNLGQVLGASTADVQLSPDSIKVNTIPDSTDAITNYLSQVQKIENGPIDTGDFQSALTSNNQDLINVQANKLAAVRDDLLKLSVPQGLAKWQQLNVIQYNAAIGLLQNFTQADSNPTLVDQDLEDFIKSQQDLQDESTVVAGQYNLNVSQLTAGVVDISQLGNNTQSGTPPADPSSDLAPASASGDTQGLNNLNLTNLNLNAQQ